MERSGLVTRDRGRRATGGCSRSRLTEAGERLFLRLRRAASSFDGRLRAGLGEADVAELRRLLEPARRERPARLRFPRSSRSAPTACTAEFTN